MDMDMFFEYLLFVAWIDIFLILFGFFVCMK